MELELEGTTINGRYEVVQKLQSGYYGTTWLAADKANGQDVCLKVRRHSSLEFTGVASVRVCPAVVMCHTLFVGCLDTSYCHPDTPSLTLAVRS